MPKPVSSLTCSFCSKDSQDVKKLLGGASGYICNECVVACYDVLEKAKEPVVETGSFPTPRKIKAHLDQYIIGQDAAKEVISVAVYNHYKRLAIPASDDVEIDKSNILLIGPTGSGKTLFARSIARLIDVPFAIADATSLTEAGYTGDDVESIITRLLQAADFDVEKAERGIIYLDEIDKKARRGDTASGSKDVSGEGVQQSLLKLLEGTVVTVAATGTRKGPHAETFRIDTTNILFICGGAFVGIEDLIKKSQRKSTATIGFGAAPVCKATINEIISQVEPEHISKFGIIPELVGRLPVIAALHELSEDELVRVLVEPKNAITKQFQALFAHDRVTLDFDPDALREIARQSIERKTGARGLRGVLEQKLGKLQFNLPDMRDDGLTRVVMTKDSILKSSEPQYVY